jgi:hypothetical protein
MRASLSRKNTKVFHMDTFRSMLELLKTIISVIYVTARMALDWGDDSAAFSS